MAADVRLNHRDWRWLLGRRFKGLPAKRTVEERYRAPILSGPGLFTAGENTYWFPSCTFATWTKADVIQIGSYTSIASGSTLLCGGQHNAASLSTFAFCLMTGEDQSAENIAPGRIDIGSDVWLAADCMVLSPVTIGHGAVVAARSVVTRDVPPYAIVHGTPARIVRYRFEAQEIQRLLALAWWEWPENLIREAVPHLRGRDIDALEQFARDQEL